MRIAVSLTPNSSAISAAVIPLKHCSSNFRSEGRQKLSSCATSIAAKLISATFWVLSPNG